MTRPLLTALGVSAAALLFAVPAHGQAPSLDRVDSLISAGAYDQARSTLDAWWSARQAFDVPGSDRVRGMMLRARLASDPDAAESDYLGIIIGHPTSPQAPQALLRLGQGLLATGQAARAAGYLQRLAADYPGRPERPLGMLWLARAHNAARNAQAACRAARDGLADAGAQPDLAAMLRVEEAAACAMGTGSQPATPAPAPSSETTRRAETAPAPANTPTADGNFAVQAGAFRYREGADALMARLRDAGYQPRAVLVPRNTLLRIRVGRFATADEAATIVAALKRSGFDAVVVGNADQERSP